MQLRCPKHRSWILPCMTTKETLVQYLDATHIHRFTPMTHRSSGNWLIPVCSTRLGQVVPPKHANVMHLQQLILLLDGGIVFGVQLVLADGGADVAGCGMSLCRCCTVVQAERVTFLRSPSSVSPPFWPPPDTELLPCGHPRAPRANILQMCVWIQGQ